MRILVLSFYFPPDLSAGSFRMGALAESLASRVPPGSLINVVTTAPNRYASFATDAPLFEERNGFTVYRIPLIHHQSGMLDQSAAFLQFGRAVLRHVESEEYDLIVATSSRLMTAVLGSWIARKKKAVLYLDIRDIFTETINDVLSTRVAWVFRGALSVIERWAIGRASRVNLVSRGFADYFRKRYPKQSFAFFTNGIDDAFLSVVPSPESTSGRALRASALTVIYAGNIGEGQGLHNILPELGKRLEGRVLFKLYGDGSRAPALRSACARAGTTNVEILPPVARDQLITQYAAADVLFLHLNSQRAFEKVLPSKLFEYAALGKPIWAGVSGYAKHFLASEVSNSSVFRPCDADDAFRAFERLELADTPRPAFTSKYARSRISRDLADDILATATNRL